MPGSAATRQTGRMEENGGQPGQRALKRYVREMGKQEESAVTWHNPRTCFVHFLDRVFFSFWFFPFVPWGGWILCRVQESQSGY